MSDKKPYKPDSLGIIYCEHPDWNKPDFMIPLGKYTFWPCLQCYRQLKATVVEDLLEPYLKNMAQELADNLLARKVKP